MSRHAAKITLLASLILRPSLWDAQAEAWSRSLPHDYPGHHAGRLSELIRDGRAQALDLVGSDGQRFGVLVYEIDRAFPQPELVIKAAFSSLGMFDITGAQLPQIEALGARLGCATVRFTTMRPGLIQKTLKHGFRVSEVVMRKSLAHV